MILFADADGATTFADVENLEKSIQKQGFDVAFGSRAHLVKSEAVIKASTLRVDYPFTLSLIEIFRDLFCATF